MLMIPARLGRSESFCAVVKVRSPHTGPEVCYAAIEEAARRVRCCPFHTLVPREPVRPPSLSYAGTRTACSHLCYI